MDRSRRTRGVSLVELAAGIAVVAVALIGTIAAIASGVSLASSTSETLAAQRAASAILEEVRGADFDTLVDTFHGESRTLSEFGIEDSRGGADIVLREVDNGSAQWTVYEVTVLVRWIRTGTPRAIEVVTYIGDRTRGGSLAGAAVVEAEG